ADQKVSRVIEAHRRAGFAGLDEKSPSEERTCGLARIYSSRQFGTGLGAIHHGRYSPGWFYLTPADQKVSRVIEAHRRAGFAGLDEKSPSEERTCGL
ncbi:hypothetical protein, partial [Enterobacter hormaechei]|uniref:hypothetical protein n=1 Tax=Enterobacter hormaechei TaxID=158836 RepID=UPI00197A7CDC